MNTQLSGQAGPHGDHAAVTNQIPKSLSFLAVAASIVAAVLTIVSLPGLADRYGLTWGNSVYIQTPLPYVVLAIVAIIFRSTTAGAVISLIGALLLGGIGVLAMHTSRDAIEIVLLPYFLLVGCGLVLLAQLFRCSARIVFGRKR